MLHKELKHLAIIPDGNRRYAQKTKISNKLSYRKGIEQVFHISKSFFNLNVEEISIFGFSIENQNRNNEEISIIQSIFLKYSNNFLKKNPLENTKINFCGNLNFFNYKLVNNLETISKKTKKGTHILNICLNYTGRDEIARAIHSSGSTEGNIKKYLDIKSNVDLLLRTGGYQRLSGFLLWQVAYSELYFTKKLWNEFTEKDAITVYNWYNKQNRNFGV